jgi:DNA-binding MarR family transcriptional regulator
MIYLHHKLEYQRIRHEANQALKSTGLNVEQFLALAEMDGKTRLRDIAENTTLASPSLSRVVTFLVENNFARRLKSKGDDRERYLKASGKGKRIIDNRLEEIIYILG